jgi:hypothetical protein
MIALRVLGYVLAAIGVCAAAFGLWSVAGGLRVIVSGRLDERSRSGKIAKIGIPFAVGGVVLLFIGIYVANWAAS